MMTKADFIKYLDFEALIEVSHNEILFLNIDGNIIYMNKVARKWHGVGDDYKQLNIKDLFVEITSSSFEKKKKELQREGGYYHDLRGINVQDQSIFYLEARSLAIRNDRKEVIGYATIGDNETRRVVTQNALYDSRKNLESIFNTAIEGIIIIEEDGLISMANPAAAQLFGYELSEMVGKNVSMLMPTSHPKQHDNYLQNYLQTGQEQIIGVGREVKGIRKDKTTFPFRLSISEVQLEHKKIFTGIVYDLTEQKRTENELLKAKEELEDRVKERTKQLKKTVNQLLQEVEIRKVTAEKLRESEAKLLHALDKEKELSELKSRFVSTASHEFRTPLSSILSSASLIGRYTAAGTEDKREKHVNRIKSNVKTLTEILDEFLSVGKLEEGGFDNDPTLFDLELFSENIIETIDSYRKKNQVVAYKHIGNQKEVYLDEQFTKNILLNLLSNAMKYSPENGKIYLETLITESAIKFTIKDNGIGIPEAEQKHLFDRFFRAKNAANIQGTGLGLNIVAQYLELMGGKITFESKENEGTTFFVILPNVKNS